MSGGLGGFARRRLSVLVALALVTTILPPSVALHGAQDDASSDSDASDTIEDALPVSPGVFEGSLVYPLDQVDYYAFDVEEGQFITAQMLAGSEALMMTLLGPGGQAYSTVLSGTPGKFLAHETGTWFLRVEGPELSDRVDEHVNHRAYTIELTVMTPELALFDPLEDGWQSMELAWDQQGTVHVFVWNQNTQRDDQPISVMKASEF